MSKPTPNTLRKLFDYDPSSGILVWKVQSGRSPAGIRAGGDHTVHGYREVGVLGTRYREHRVIWAWYHLKWPIGHLDHVNGIRDDNRIENLREVTLRENALNQQKRSDNTSGVPGVYWEKPLSKWRAYIETVDGRLWLGCHEHWFDAVCARKSAEHRHSYHVNHGRERVG